MTGLRRPGAASSHEHRTGGTKQKRRASSWLSSEARGVLIGVVTFLLLQVFAQYRTLHLWEEMQKTSKNIEEDIHFLSSEVKSSLGGAKQSFVKRRNANDSSPVNSFFDDQAQNSDVSSIISQSPAWLEDYIVWHNEQRNKLTPQNYQNTSILVLRCLTSDSDQCGMARHRLQSVPFALLLAAKSQRIIFIKWEQPAPLEEFLLPASLDWKMPDWLHEAIGDYDRFTIIKGTSDFGIKQAMGPQNIVNLRPNSKDGGRTFYNDNRKGGTNNDVGFDMAFRSIWHRIFRPSQPIEILFQHHLSALNLIQGQYLILHMPEYADRTDVPRIALDCAKQIHPSAFATTNSPPDDDALSVVVSSPSRSYIDTAVGFTGGNMVALKTSVSFLTFDRDTLAWKNKTASQYYQSFAYLHLMTNSRSVIFHHGDLDGKWGTLLSMDPLSGARYRRQHRSVECHRFTSEEMNPPPSHGSQEHDSHRSAQHLVSPQHKGVIVSPKFPTWMNDYFTWHKEQRALLTKENWKQHKYLLIRCFEEDQKCGGASDRLQSTPLALLFASLSKRLLFIKWQRPSALEEFLLPPQNGLDWRLPDWLHEKFLESKDYDKSRIVVTSAYKPFIKSSRLVLMRPQKFWPEFFDERKSSSEDLSYEQLFHYAWESLFQPTSPVNDLIQKHLTELNLEAGKYISAHVRAKYSKDKSNDVASIENAVNCASMLRPGWPIYFASDSVKAVQTAVEYGKRMGGIVVARENETEPLHLDRGKFFMHHWGKQGFHDEKASQYYDVFVDIYLLGKSQCVTTGAGGYGRLGSMLSFNRTCTIEHTNTTCQWQGGGSGVISG